MISLTGGTFLMGTDGKEGFPIDKEGPRQIVNLEPFSIAPYPVTNEDFLHFYLATGYITDAERFGSSNVFHLLLESEYKPLSSAIDWWYEVPDANWRCPEGKGSSIKDRMDHPVVHVSWNDAMAYCKWADVRLPTEAEWEYAAKGGQDTLFPWGNELVQNGVYRANTWQGEFPVFNTLEDGYLGTAPVRTYEPNNYGIYQMIGNVWEWCLNPGRISLSEFTHKKSDIFVKENVTPSAESYALKGGSFLCHASYCQRYRIAGRNANTAHSSSSNTGFRVVKS
ncbi:formylglycine-generating enzyme family protein [Macrococcus hajekii]|uniref:Formylglycine-generating enzyme family protein n=1 Tax=Macrococcus hajekii TaxID=198482 RepID=A0A4R6BK16_9STAP|nr:formylglycine-generating enzyme family protein [Macrococcus hajekii]TDM01980.1 formylglycine-generating enzyme family protein [Macrococcus hajekii]GGB09031.1 hypothetical protein GCM10007190_16360 [Macrococcus hajekii]